MKRKIDEKGIVRLIESGGRMGGDCIGSDLVQLSTGVDFVKAVIQCALDEKPEILKQSSKAAGIRFIFDQTDICAYQRLQTEHPEWLIRADVKSIAEDKLVTDSSNRYGYFLMCSEQAEQLMPYMPAETLKD